MSLNVNKPQPNKSFVKQEALPAGNYPGRLVQIVAVGLQPQKAYQGVEKKPAYQAFFNYELADEFMLDEDGNEIEDKPRWVGERLSLLPLFAERAKSTARYKALDPSEVHEGDFAALVGQGVNITVSQYESKGEMKNGVMNLTPMRPKDLERLPELKNATLVFDIEAPTEETWSRVPDWMKEICKSNLEFKGSALEAFLNGQPKQEEAPKSVEQEIEPAFDLDEDAPY